MSLKLKALGLALVAALAMSALAVISASAETGGHFTSEVDHVILEGNDVAGNNPVLQDPAIGAKITCENAKYTGTISSETTTVTEATVNAAYEKCQATEPVQGPVVVDMNGCAYIFTIRKTEPQAKDNTTHVECPEGKVIAVTIQGPFGLCTATLKAQTPAGGVAYATGGEGKTHDITGKVTVSGIHAVYDGGFLKCGVAEGKTTETSTLNGESTLKGFNTAGEQVGITATGF